MKKLFCLLLLSMLGTAHAEAAPPFEPANWIDVCDSYSIPDLPHTFRARCGFYAIDGRVIRPEFPRIESTGFGFDDHGLARAYFDYHTRVGVIDSHGVWRVPPLYSAWKFEIVAQDVMAVWNDDHDPINGKSLLLRFDGTPVSQQAFDQIDVFGDDGEQILVRQNGYVGLIDRHGQWLIKPDHYTWLRRTSCGNLLFNTRPESISKGLMNLQGKVLLPERYTDIAILPELDQCQSAIVSTDEKSFGLLDIRTRRWILPPRYQALRPFDGQRYIARLDGKFGVIDRQQQWLVRPQYDELYIPDNGYALFKATDGGSYYGVMNLQGEEVYLITPAHDHWADNFHVDPYGMVTHQNADGQCSYFDIPNEQPVPGVFDQCSPFSRYDRHLQIGRDGIALVKKNDLYGFIDRTGKVVVPLQYIDTWGNLYWHHQKMMLLQDKQQRWHIITTAGTLLPSRENILRELAGK
ncbi:MAG: WG repeat-containing protein [Neisseria sp.]|nr:WG repeat-containing protein [Neisseria sp.]